MMSLTSGARSPTNRLAQSAGDGLCKGTVKSKIARNRASGLHMCGCRPGQQEQAAMVLCCLLHTTQLAESRRKPHLRLQAVPCPRRKLPS